MRALLLWFFLISLGYADTPRPKPERFADEVAAIAAKETPEGEIVFTGSSSIRLWKSLKSDFPGLPVHNHGFGGSVANDLLVYFDEIIARHEPRLIVLYTGSNDIHYKLSAEEAFSDYRELLERIHERLPEARVIVNSIKVGDSRFDQIPTVREVNEKLEAWTEDRPWVRYVEATDYLVDDEGKPIPRYYVEDRLHLSAEGYEEWRRILEPVVREEWERLTGATR